MLLQLTIVFYQERHKLQGFNLKNNDVLPSENELLLQLQEQRMSNTNHIILDYGHE